jgi:hypothetical protein
MAECPHCGEMFDEEDAWFEHGRLQAEAERLQAARAAGKARIAELEAVLERVAVWVEKLPVPTNGACAQLARIDAALSRQGKESEV